MHLLRIVVAGSVSHLSAPRFHSKPCSRELACAIGRSSSPLRQPMTPQRHVVGRLVDSSTTESFPYSINNDEEGEMKAQAWAPQLEVSGIGPASDNRVSEV